MSDWLMRKLGYTPTSVYEANKKLQEEQVKKERDSYAELYKRVKEAGHTELLEGLPVVYWYSSVEMKISKELLEDNTREIHTLITSIANEPRTMTPDEEARTKAFKEFLSITPLGQFVPELAEAKEGQVHD